MSSSSLPSSPNQVAREQVWGPVLCGAAMATVGTSVVASKLIGTQIGFAQAGPALVAVMYAWVPTVIGFWLWYAGARRATATQAALSTAWLPVVAVIGAAIVLGEALTLTQGVALGLVLAGVVVGAVEVLAPPRLKAKDGRRHVQQQHRQPCDGQFGGIAPRAERGRHVARDTSPRAP